MERDGRIGGLDEMKGEILVGNGRMERWDKKRGTEVWETNSDHLCQSNIRFYILSRCTWKVAFE